MLGYIGRRLLLAIPVLIGVSILVFSIIRLIPGDPARAVAGVTASAEYIEQVRKELLLDEPLYVQYSVFISNLFRGDLGRSTFSGRQVSVELSDRFPVTLTLASAGMLLATIIGLGTGVVSATRRYSFFDNATMLGALIGVAMPVFWLGVMFQIVFAVRLGWLPSGGIGTWQHYILPVMTLGLATTGLVARITRSSMLEVLNKEYIITARSKGLSERVVVYKHALKNALIPVVTVIGLQFGVLLGGAVLIEMVFSLPGIGRLVVDSILYRDYPVVQGAVILLAGLFVLINILVDVIYALLDPRISYSDSEVT